MRLVKFNQFGVVLCRAKLLSAANTFKIIFIIIPMVMERYLQVF